MMFGGFVEPNLFCCHLISVKELTYVEIQAVPVVQKEDVVTWSDPVLLWQQPHAPNHNMQLWITILLPALAWQKNLTEHR